MASSNIHIAVIGGGCAGLSAAVKLVDLGFKVTIFEASSQFGGRARMVMVENKREMTMLDNGQHILLGAYRETLTLLRKVGVKESDVFTRMPLQMHMLSSLFNRPFSIKSFDKLPAPLNLLMALVFCKGLSIADRIKAIKFMRTIQRQQYQIDHDIPLEDFLANHQQSERVIKVLWEPLCLAALNTPIDVASSKIFLNVLRDTFSGDKSNSDFLLPKLDLSQVIANPLSQYIYAKGGKLKLSQRIRGLEVTLDEHDNEIFKLETKTGFSYFSHVVMAVSPARLDKLIQKIPKLSNVINIVNSMHYQPIYTIYIQYPTETKLPSMMTGLTDSIGQWVFDRGQMCKQKGLIAVIISAEGMHQQYPQDQLALKVIQEIHLAFADLAKPLWHKVIAEKRATFSCNYHVHRPGNRTMQANLFLAGDYTYQDYPATIEGAVRSGLIAAEMIAHEPLF